MQTFDQRAERRDVTPLRKLGAIILLIVAMTLLVSCGGGSSGGQDNGGQGSKQAGDGGGKKSDANKGGANKGGANKGGGTGGVTGGATGGDKPAITNVRTVAASPNKKGLNNTRVRLKGAEVRNIVSERVFYVGGNDAEQLLVVSVKGGVQLQEGQKALVAGRLRTPSPEMEKGLSLSPEEAKAVNEQDIVLTAPQVQPKKK